MNISDNKWNTPYDNSKDYKWISTSQLTLILNNISVPKSARALDVGCGTGQLCRDLVHRGMSVKGIDISSTAITQARRSTNFPVSEIEFVICDIENDKIDFGKFDLVFCKYVLAFIANKSAFLKNISSLKTIDGTFIVVSPDIETLPDLKKNIALDHQSTIDLLSEHFDDVSFDKVDGDYYYYSR